MTKFKIYQFNEDKKKELYDLAILCLGTESREKHVSIKSMHSFSQQ